MENNKKIPRIALGAWSWEQGQLEEIREDSR